MSAQLFQFKPAQIKRKIKELDALLNHQFHMYEKAFCADLPTEQLFDVMTATVDEINYLERQL